MGIKTKKEIRFCSDLSQAVKEEILSNLDFESSRHDWIIKERLLTDERMNQVWVKFKKKFPEDLRSQNIIGFIAMAQAAQLDAEERFISKRERERIKNLKKKVDRQVGKLLETIREIDDFCSGPETFKRVTKAVLDGSNSLENQMKSVNENLLRQVAFYKWDVQPRLHFFIPKDSLSNLSAIRNRGQSNFIEMFTREAISGLFVRHLGGPYHAMAADVSSVMSGLKPDSGTREQRRDRTRGRQKTLRYRSKKKINLSP